MSDSDLRQILLKSLTFAFENSSSDYKKDDWVFKAVSTLIN